MTDFAAAIRVGDPRLFDAVPAQTSDEDRKALLAIQNAVAERVPGYAYIEVGSHLGGSLLPHLADERCRIAVSIDPRPATQADERGRAFINQKHVSTAHMLELLERALGATPMVKLRTIEMDAAGALATGTLPAADLVFIDGEHTNIAILSDFLNMRRAAKPDSIFAFHDGDILWQGLVAIETVLRDQGIAFKSAYVGGRVFALGVGAMAPAIPHGIDRPDFIALAQRKILRKHARAYLWSLVGVTAR